MGVVDLLLPWLVNLIVFLYNFGESNLTLKTQKSTEIKLEHKQTNWSGQQ